MRILGMESRLWSDTGKRTSRLRRPASPPMPVRCGKAAVVAVIAGAIGLSYLPSAHAVPTYIYLYTGKPFDQGPFFDPNDPRTGGGITLKITSPTPLFASDADQKGIPGLNYWMSDSVFSLQYPAYQPAYDYWDPVSFSAGLYVYALGSDGLPTSWDIQLGKTEGRHNSSYLALESAYYGNQPTGNVPWDNSTDSGYGPMYIVNDPGQWRMYVETNPLAVPEPPASFLLGLGGIAMAAVRYSRRGRRSSIVPRK